MCWLRQEDQIPLISTRKRRKGGRGGEDRLLGSHSLNLQLASLSFYGILERAALPLT